MDILYTKKFFFCILITLMCTFHFMLMLPVWHLSASVYNSSYCAACQGKIHAEQITPNLYEAC
jgi:hypothetical protein